MSRFFDGAAGIDEYITLAPGTLQNGGPITVMWYWRPDTGEANQHGGFLSGRTGGSNQWSASCDGGNYFHESDFTGYDGVDPGEWQIIGYSKPSTNSNVRWHFYTLSTLAWDHADGTASGDGSNIDEVLLGIYTPGTGRLRGWWVCAAVWNSVLTDQQVEDACSSIWLLVWYQGNPDALWSGDQPTTSDPVIDRTGNGADQTATLNPAVSSEEPPAWTYELDNDIHAHIEQGLTLTQSVVVSIQSGATAAISQGLQLSQSVATAATVEVGVSQGLQLNQSIQANVASSAVITQGLVLGQSVQVSTSASTEIAQGLVLDQDVAASTSASAAVTQGLALDQQVQASVASPSASITEGLTLDQSVDASLATSAQLAQGLVLDQSVQVSIASPSAVITEGLVLDQSANVSLSADAQLAQGLVLDQVASVLSSMDATLTQGLVLDQQVNASVQSGASVSEGLTLGHAVNAQSTVNATVLSGLTLDQSASVDVVFSGAIISEGLVLDQSMTAHSGSTQVGISQGLVLSERANILVEIVDTGRPIKSLCEGRPIKPVLMR